MAKPEHAVITHEASTTLVGDLLVRAMEDQGVSIRDLATKADITYEHIRRIVRGESIPSKFILRLICDLLKVNFKEAERLATSDRITKKYGTIPLELSGKKPGLDPIERIWDQLTADQQQDAITMIQSWVKRNRAARAS